MDGPADDYLERLPVALRRKLVRAAGKYPALAFMILNKAPLTPNAWAELEYEAPFDELEAEALCDFPQVLEETEAYFTPTGP